MRYNPVLVQPMREELTRLGFEELHTVEDVDATLGAEQRSMLVVVNSVCGCSAAMARPAVVKALHHNSVPERLVTVFAGMEVSSSTARWPTCWSGAISRVAPQISLLPI